MRNQIFISYSHADSEYQLRLRKHLSIFERAGNIKYWSDTQLRTGDQWRKEIDENLQKTAVAILLISADFLASDFIRSNELPPLLEAWSQSGVFILPVIVKPCSFSHVKELSVFQAANDPERTISLPQCQVMNSKKGKKYPLSIKRRGDICDTNYNLFAFQRIHKIIAKRP